MTEYIMRFTNKALIVLVAALAFTATGLAGFAGAAWAQAAIKIKPGLGGLYNLQGPVELQITILNSGDALKGHLVVDREPPPRIQNIDQLPLEYRLKYQQEIEIKAGETKTQRLIVPGNLLSSQARVSLVSDGRVLATGRVEGTAVSGNNGLYGLTLGEGALSSGISSWLDKSMEGQVALKYLPPEELPTNSILLHGINLIIVDPAAANKLTAQQAETLREWTILGGKLLLSGGAGAGPGEIFNSLSPVVKTGSAAMDGSLGGLRPPGGALNIARGQLQSGRILASAEGLPVLAVHRVGRGDVFFCAPDLADLRGENSGLWAALLGQPADSIIQTSPMDAKIRFDSIPTKIDMINRDSMAHAGTYLPMLKLPSVPLLASLWVVYIAVAGPALYYLLRRRGKQDRAWLLIPAVALTTAVFFFFLAPTHRIKGYHTQTLAAMDILEPGLAVIESSGTVVVPRGGNISIKAREDFMLEPYLHNISQNREPVTVTADGKTWTLEYKNVEYASIRQAVAYGTWRSAGSVEGKIKLSATTIEGTLKNNTGFDLRDCKLLVSDRLIDIGDMPNNSTRQFTENLDKWQFQTTLNQLNKQLSNLGDEYIREKNMLNEQISRRSLQGGVMFLGWNDTSPPLFETQKPGATGTENGLLLVKQHMELDFSEESFILPAGFLRPQIFETDGGFEERPDGMIMHGKWAGIMFDMSRALPQQDYELTSISFTAPPPEAGYGLEAYRWAARDWIKISSGEKIQGEQMAQLISNDLKVRIKLIKSSSESSFVPVSPGMVVEGALEQ